MDICASISSIFFSVVARSSGFDGIELWKNEGRAIASCPASTLAAAHLAQHVELALAHEVVAPLALDHLLEHLLGVRALAVGVGLGFAPGRGGVLDEPHHAGQQPGRR
jgi:hypothetical protein